MGILTLALRCVEGKSVVVCLQNLYIRWTECSCGYSDDRDIANGELLEKVEQV